MVVVFLAVIAGRAAWIVFGGSSEESLSSREEFEAQFEVEDTVFVPGAECGQ
jgi:hypothetical protein